MSELLLWNPRRRRGKHHRRVGRKTKYGCRPHKVFPKGTTIRWKGKHWRWKGLVKRLGVTVAARRWHHARKILPPCAIKWRRKHVTHRRHKQTRSWMTSAFGSYGGQPLD